MTKHRWNDRNCCSVCHFSRVFCEEARDVRGRLLGCDAPSPAARFIPITVPAPLPPRGIEAPEVARAISILNRGADRRTMGAWPWMVK